MESALRLDGILGYFICLPRHRAAKVWTLLVQRDKPLRDVGQEELRFLKVLHVANFEVARSPRVHVAAERADLLRPEEGAKANRPLADKREHDAPAGETQQRSSRPE